MAATTDGDDPRGVGWTPAPDRAESSAPRAPPESPERPSPRCPPDDRAGLVGRVGGLTRREEGSQARETIIEFRLERHDAAGDRLPPLPVEVRGLSIEGVLHEGDEVEITDFRAKRGVIRARSLQNRTNGSTVRPTNASRTVALVVFFVLLMLTFGLAFFAWRWGAG